MSTTDDLTSDIFLRAMATLKAGHPAEGAELLRQAASTGHAEAQNQLARLYFAGLREAKDLASLEVSAQNGDHVALFVLAMSFLDGKLVEKDTEAAILALRHAAEKGNLMAARMLSQQG